jgi:hypothetical protein
MGLNQHVLQGSWYTNYDRALRQAASVNCSLPYSREEWVALADLPLEGLTNSSEMHIDMLCLTCTEGANNISIASLMKSVRGTSTEVRLNCDCHQGYLGERVVWEKLKLWFPAFKVERGAVHCISASNTTLTFDISVKDGTVIRIIVEVDGPHHFGPFQYRGRQRTEQELRALFKKHVVHDHYKERDAVWRKIVLLRVPWSELMNDPVGTQVPVFKWLKHQITKTLTVPSAYREGKVRCYPCPSYTDPTGAYRKERPLTQFNDGEAYVENKAPFSDSPCYLPTVGHLLL